MSMTNVNIRMDSQLKARFEEFCKNVGMTMTTAFTIFAKESVEERKIPFDIVDHTDPFYSKENLDLLKKSINQVKEGKVSKHDLIEV